MKPATHITPANVSNRLGMNYHAEAARLPWGGPIVDVHVHLGNVQVARDFFRVADWFGVTQVWTQTHLEDIDPLRDAYGDRLVFIAIPNYLARHKPETFSTDWLRRLERFREKGARMAKFWAAPRGRDFHPSFSLDHPTRLEAMRVAKSLGMRFMTHVADPDTWFSTHYRDHRRYGTKASHYEPLRRLLDEHGDVVWNAAHMAGDPEHLDHLQELLDRHSNLHIDTGATKWMVRELSKTPAQLREFCRRNAGRVMFGSDIVAANADLSLPSHERMDLYASRYWALRALFETGYEGESPIADPDLSLVNPSLPADAAPTLRGASLDPSSLRALYLDASRNFSER